jgi:hypothetical protein
MGLGLVRLLQGAGRTVEARRTLRSLENGFQWLAVEWYAPRQKPRKPRRLKGVSRRGRCVSASA